MFIRQFIVVNQLFKHFPGSAGTTYHEGQVSGNIKIASSVVSQIQYQVCSAFFSEGGECVIQQRHSLPDVIIK